MSEMVERVARALCVEAFRDPEDISGGVHPSGAWLDEGEPWWTGYVDIARAAIAAMREPTDAMLDAGMGHDRGTKGEPWTLMDGEGYAPAFNARNVWRAMIDVAPGPAQDETGRKETG